MSTNKEHNYNICNTFKEWLSTNGYRFNHKFKIRHYKSRGFLNIYFENVTPEIVCSVNENIGVDVDVYLRRKYWDSLSDFDCAIKRAKNRKYYCAFCEEPQYYKTPQELLINHSFETFLKWANEKFTSSHVLELRKSVGGSTEAIIIDTSLPDSLYTERRAAFGNLLTALSDDDPITIKNLDKMKIMVIPIIKGKGSHGQSGMERGTDKQTLDKEDGKVT